MSINSCSIHIFVIWFLGNEIWPVRKKKLNADDVLNAWHGYSMCYAYLPTSSCMEIAAISTVSILLCLLLEVKNGTNWLVASATYVTLL